MKMLQAPTTATALKVPRSATAADVAFSIGWAVIAAAFVGWILVLIPVWASKDEMNDRFLIPAASVVLLWMSLPRLRAMPLRSQWLSLLPLAIGAAAFALGWYIAVQVSSRPIVVWWLTGALILMILAMALVYLGWRQALLILFPSLFLLFALPTPGRIYNPLTLRLKQFTTTTAQHVLPYLGVDVQRPDPDSFELKLESGDLGVVEACSGVRSTIPLTAIAFLVAYVKRFSLGRWVLLIGLSIPIIALANAARVILTGVLQEYIGISAISGWKHHALGYFAILFGLSLIVGLAQIIAPRGGAVIPKIGEPLSLSQHGLGATIRGFACVAMLLPAAAACMWAEQFRIDHRVAVRLEQLPMKLGHWEAESLEVPEPIIDELKCDQMVYRVYRNQQGQTISVHVMFWANAATTAHSHHPDICYPSRGWQVTRSNMKPLTLRGGDELPISVRHYHRPEQQQVLAFWSQTGSQVLADGIEKPELMSGHSWIFEMLRHGHQPIDSGARLQVLIGTTTRGNIEAGEKVIQEFTTQFAENIYQLCPWARPTTSQ